MISDAPTPPSDWGGYGRRILEWWNTLADFVNQLRTDTDTNTTAVEDAVVWQDFTPSFGALTFSASTARYARVGKMIHVEFRGTISGTAGDFYSITLPVAMANGVSGDILSWGEWVYQDVNTVYVAKPFVSVGGTSVSARPIQADGLGNGAWRVTGNQPVAPASGDVVSFSMTYEGV